jgi:hypothetical protein
MKKIIVHFDPTVELLPLKVTDDESESSQSNSRGDKLSKKAGNGIPFVEINGITFTETNINFFEISLEDFLPELTLVINDATEYFINNHFPTDGDIIKLLVQGNNSDFKPIRQDYRLISLEGSPGNGENNVYTIKGILDFPQLFIDQIKSFSQLSTVDTLKKIAKELKLGFSSNETQTNDVMTRICPNTDYMDFILNDILLSSYKNDSCFYQCFIDQHYYLNFVEVNELVVTDYEFDKINNTVFMNNYGSGATDNSGTLEFFFISNGQESAGKPNFINSYIPVNKSGEISMNYGYRNYLLYYDKKSRQLKEFFLESLANQVDSTKQLLKGRESEDHTKQIKVYNFGSQFEENVHKEYYYSKVQNNLNIKELEKLNLVVNLVDATSMIYKYQILPVQIINKSYLQTLGNNQKEEGFEDLSINKFLSGLYLIKSMNYTYSKSLNGLMTKLVLSRREFIKPIRVE